MENINYLSLIIATLIPTAVGFIFYHKAVMGSAWMAATGITEEKAKESNMTVVFGVSIVMSFFLSFFLLVTCNAPGQEGEYDTFKHGAFHGFLLAFLVAMPVLITVGLYEQRSWKHMLINCLYWIITLTIMGGIVDAMNQFPNSLAIDQPE